LKTIKLDESQMQKLINKLDIWDSDKNLSKLITKALTFSELMDIPRIICSKDIDDYVTRFWDTDSPKDVQLILIEGVSIVKDEETLLYWYLVTNIDEREFEVDVLFIRRLAGFMFDIPDDVVLS